MKRILKLAMIIAVAQILFACAHKGTVSSVTPTNIYSDSENKVGGKFSYVIDQTSLTKLKKDDTVQGYACSAHHFPVDGTEAFISSVPPMLDQVFEDIQKANEGESRTDRIQLLFRVERFEPRLKFNQKFFGLDAEATAELAVSVTGSKNGVRVFGTTVESQRTKSGDGGSFCSGGGVVVADAVRDSIKDVLEKLGERAANSQNLRKIAASDPTKPLPKK